MNDRKEWRRSAFDRQVQYRVAQGSDPRSSQMTIDRVLDSKNFEPRRVTLGTEAALQGLPRDLATVEREHAKIPAANRRILDRVWQCRAALLLAAANPAFGRAVTTARRSLEFARDEMELRTAAVEDLDQELDALYERALEDPMVQAVAEGLAVDFGLLNFDFALESVVRGVPPPLSQISWGGVSALGIDCPGFKHEDQRFAHPWYWLNSVHEFERTEEHFLLDAAPSLLKVVVTPPPGPPLTRIRANWETQPLTSIWIHAGAANSEVDVCAAWPKVLKLKKRLRNGDSSPGGLIETDGLEAVLLPDNPQQPAYLAFPVYRQTTLATAREHFRQATARRRELRGGNLRTFRSPKDPDSLVAAIGALTRDFSAASTESAYPDGDAFRKAYQRMTHGWGVDEMDGATED